MTGQILHILARHILLRQIGETANPKRMRRKDHWQARRLEPPLQHPPHIIRRHRCFGENACLSFRGEAERRKPLRSPKGKGLPALDPTGDPRLMAIYALQVKHRAKGKGVFASAHAFYIAREGKYAERRAEANACQSSLCLLPTTKEDEGVTALEDRTKEHGERMTRRCFRKTYSFPPYSG